MPVFMFICSEEDGTWNAKQFKKEGDATLQAEAGSPFELERKLVNLALQEAGSGGVTSSFNYITPSSAVYEVIVGGGGGGFSAGGGGGGAASGGAAPEAAAVEEKKEEKVEEKEESDDDMGFSLFD